MDGVIDSVVRTMRLTTQGQIYFYHRWCELVNPKTTDSYLHRVLNSVGSIKEILDILESIDAGDTTLAALLSALEECGTLLDADPVLSKHAEPSRKQLKIHVESGKKKAQDLLSNPKKDRRSFLLGLRAHAGYAFRQIEPNYLQWALIDLKAAIDGNSIREVEALLSLLASEAVRLGRSLRPLYTLRELFRDSRKAFDDKWLEFQSSLTKPKTQFECVFAEESPIEDEAARNAGLSFSSGEDVKERLTLPDGATEPTTRYFCLTVDAYDHEAAFCEGIYRASQAMDLLSFFQVARPWPKQTPRALVVDLVSNTRKDLNYEVMISDWNHSVDYSAELLQKTFTAISAPRLPFDPRSREQIQRSLLYTRLSALAPFQEVGFLNLWVALESFVTTGQHQSKIAHVTNTVSAALCGTYYYRLLKTFAEDCQRCSVPIPTAAGDVTGHGVDPRQLVEMVLAAIMEPGLMARFRTNCAVNLLLTERLVSIGSTLSTGLSASAALANHSKKVSWHLSRLYRIRNDIAHSASGNKPLIPLIRTLRDYLTLTVSHSVNLLSTGQYSSLGEVFAAMEDNLGATVDALKNTPNYDKQWVLDGVMKS